MKGKSRSTPQSLHRQPARQGKVPDTAGVGGKPPMQNLLDELTGLLQSEQTFISDGAILKNVVIEAALNMQPNLLQLLMQSKTIKKHFFTQIGGGRTEFLSLTR